MESSFSLTVENLDQTLLIGEKTGGLMKAGHVIALSGELGAGKTTLVKAIAGSFDIPAETVCSPSYTIVNEYEGSIPLYHFDLYRLEGADDIGELGFEEYFEGNGLSIVEWADVAPQSLPDERLEIQITISGDDRRRFDISGVGDEYVRIVKELEKQLRGAIV